MTVDRTDDATVDISARTDQAQDRLRRQLGAESVLDNDPSTGSPRMVARLDGFLTPASSKAAQAIVLGYLRDHAAAFGMEPGDVAELRLSSLDRGPDGTVHLSWEQRSDGIPNVDGGVQAAVTTEGRLINVRGSVLSGGDAESLEPLVGPAVAYAAAVPDAAPVPPPAVSASADRRAHFAGGGWGSLVTYQDEGEERLGWQLLVPGGPAAFYHALVDARSGRLQRRANLVRSASSINHFNVNPEAEGGVATAE